MVQLRDARGRRFAAHLLGPPAKKPFMGLCRHLHFATQVQTNKSAEHNELRWANLPDLQTVCRARLPPSATHSTTANTAHIRDAMAGDRCLLSCAGERVRVVAGVEGRERGEVGKCTIEQFGGRRGGRRRARCA